MKSIAILKKNNRFLIKELLKYNMCVSLSLTLLGFFRMNFFPLGLYLSGNDLIPSSQNNSNNHKFTFREETRPLNQIVKSFDWFCILNLILTQSCSFIYLHIVSGCVLHYRTGVSSPRVTL